MLINANLVRGLVVTSMLVPAISSAEVVAFPKAEVLAIDCPAEVKVGESTAFVVTLEEDEDIFGETIELPNASYQWNLGDGTKGTGLIARHSYSRPGTYVVTFSVNSELSQTDRTSRFSCSSSDTMSCTVNVR